MSNLQIAATIVWLTALAGSVALWYLVANRVQAAVWNRGHEDGWRCVALPTLAGGVAYFITGGIATALFVEVAS